MSVDEGDDEEAEDGQTNKGKGKDVTDIAGRGAGHVLTSSTSDVLTDMRESTSGQSEDCCAIPQGLYTHRDVCIYVRIKVCALVCAQWSVRPANSISPSGWSVHDTINKSANHLCLRQPNNPPMGILLVRR